MPTYDYVCQNCEHAFEEFQSITAKMLRKCPECGEAKLKRLIGTGAGVIFKGGGFYETDYRSDSYQKGAKAEKDAASGKSNKTDKGKADKSETKSTPKDGGGKKAESKSTGNTARPGTTKGK